ncbi:Amino acid transporter transmembrane domain-containing protein [[Candida] zeylanoides]
MADTQGTASTQSSAISLIKTIIGAGLLSMPLAFSTDGLFLGFWIILLAGLTSGYGLFLQAYVAKYVPSGNATFFNLCSITYPSLSVIFDVAIAIQCFGCAISYLVLIGDLMPTIVPNYGNTSFWIAASSVVCVPLSFMKNLDSLKYTSILGLVAIGYMSLLVVGHYVADDIRDPDLKGPVSWWPQSISAIFSTFAIIVFAFTGHQNMFSIINESRNKSLPSLAVLILVAIAVSAALFIVVGLTGYLTFGSHVTGNIILSYPAAISTTLGRFCIVFMVVFSFPLMIHPARISVNNIYYWVQQRITGPQVPPQRPIAASETEPLLSGSSSSARPVLEAPVVPLSAATFNVLTTLLLAVGYVAAITVKSFAFVLTIVGATGSTSISFILPGLFGFSLIGSESQHPSKVEKVLKALSLALVVWGFLVMALCLYTALLL